MLKKASRELLLQQAQGAYDHLHNIVSRPVG